MEKFVKVPETVSPTMELVLAIFGGGLGDLCDAIGIERSNATKWRDRYPGGVSPRYRDPILAALRKRLAEERARLAEREALLAETEENVR